MRWWPDAARTAALAVLCGVASGCGYHVSGKATEIPKNLQTIAIPAFKNLTVRYNLTDALPEAMAREFIARTKYKVIPDEKQADMVLKGAVVRYVSFPVISDQATGRAVTIQMNVTLQVSLIRRKTNDILWTRPSFDYRQRYQISVDQTAYFEESNVGLRRLSQDVARDVVSAILENF